MPLEPEFGIHKNDFAPVALLWMYVHSGLIEKPGKDKEKPEIKIQSKKFFKNEVEEYEFMKWLVWR